MMNLVKDSCLESEKHSIYSEMSNVWRNHCGKGRKELWSSLKCLSHLAMELGGRSDFWQKRLIGIQQLLGNLCWCNQNSSRIQILTAISAFQKEHLKGIEEIIGIKCGLTKMLISPRYALCSNIIVLSVKCQWHWENLWKQRWRGWND